MKFTIHIQVAWNTHGDRTARRYRQYLLNIIIRINDWIGGIAGQLNQMSPRGKIHIHGTLVESRITAIR